MNTTNQIASALKKSGIPFVRVEGVADGTEYLGLSVRHKGIHAEVRECSKWVEMKVFHFTPEQFMSMLVGRSCESCPEMDNPDSYISHLSAALKWHDEHVPRPTNPRNTCVVLQGEKPPEEVLFVGPDGVTHYKPEDVGTCHVKAVKKLGESFGFILSCGHSMVSPFNDCPHHCPWCGARVVSE